MLGSSLFEVYEGLGGVCGPGYVGRNQELAIYLPVVLQQLKAQDATCCARRLNLADFQATT